MHEKARIESELRRAIEQTGPVAKRRGRRLLRDHTAGRTPAEAVRHFIIAAGAEAGPHLGPLLSLYVASMCWAQHDAAPGWEARTIGALASALDMGMLGARELAESLDYGEAADGADAAE